MALTDGGNSLDNLMDIHFPRAERILDIYHAAEYLGDLAKASCGDAADAEELVGEWSHQMRHEGGAAILATLESLDFTGRSPAAREALRIVTNYVRNNLHRLDYPHDREQGWQIGSGHIEAACRTVVNLRLNQSGRRWGSDEFDASCHLRALYEGEPGQ